MSPARPYLTLPALAWLALAILTAAGAASGDTPAEAIRRVLAADSELGAARNHAPEDGPLADAVSDYVAALDGLDFRGCPADFAAAFARHRDAWEASVELFRRHGELRGEMHQLFEAIRELGGETRAELEGAEQRIWNTWAEVEATAEKHGARPPEEEP